MRFLCRWGFHRYGGEGEQVSDLSIVQASVGITVVDAGYYRYYCTRCGIASDHNRGDKQ